MSINNSIILLSIIFSCTTNGMLAQNVGVGTNSPHPSAQLEISSTNKGLLLPRVDDTTVVSAPAEGLVVYNKNLKTPNFFDGSRWQSVEKTLSTTADTDSITYTVSASVNSFAAGTYTLKTARLDANMAVVNNTASKVNFSDIIFIKTTDNNSYAFIRALTNGTNVGAYIEIKYYKQGSSTPYYSIKGSNFYVTGFNLDPSSGSLLESISIAPLIFGYKNWINNTSWAWNVQTASSTSY